MFNWLRNLATMKTDRSDRVRGRFAWFPSIRARYDAAHTSDENRRHWANADHLSANAAGNVNVRRILRNRARYEVANNGYARGLVNTLANYVIGTGPRLQMLTGDPNSDRVIEREFMRWAKSVRLAQRLWTMRVSQCESGEVFAVRRPRSGCRSGVPVARTHAMLRRLQRRLSKCRSYPRPDL